MTSQRPASKRTLLHNDTLVRGVILILIGLTLLIAPHWMADTPTREVFLQARIPAWFGLVLGAAFVLHFWRQHQRDQRHASRDQ